MLNTPYNDCSILIEAEMIPTKHKPTAEASAACTSSAHELRDFVVFKRAIRAGMTHQKEKVATDSKICRTSGM